MGDCQKPTNLSIKGPIYVPKCVARKFGKKKRYFGSKQEEKNYDSQYTDVKLEVPSIRETVTDVNTSLETPTEKEGILKYLHDLDKISKTSTFESAEDKDYLSSENTEENESSDEENLTPTPTNSGCYEEDEMYENLFPELDIIPDVEITEDYERIVNENLKTMDEFRNFLAYGEPTTRILPSRGLMPEGALEENSSESSVPSFTSLNSHSNSNVQRSVKKKKCNIL